MSFHLRGKLKLDLIIGYILMPTVSKTKYLFFFITHKNNTEIKIADKKYL